MWSTINCSCIIFVAVLNCEARNHIETIHPRTAPAHLASAAPSATGYRHHTLSLGHKGVALFNRRFLLQRIPIAIPCQSLPITKSGFVTRLPNQLYLSIDATDTAMALPVNTTRGSKISHPPHPYYPVEVEIAGYVANEKGVLELLSIFAAGCTVLFFGTYLVSKKIHPKLPGSEVITVMWFVLSMYTHLQESLKSASLPCSKQKRRACGLR